MPKTGGDSTGMFDFDCHPHLRQVVEIKYVSARAVKKMITSAGVVGISAQTVQSVNAMVDEMTQHLVDLSLGSDNAEIGHERILAAMTGAYFSSGTIAEAVLEAKQIVAQESRQCNSSEQWHGLVASDMQAEVDRRDVKQGDTLRRQMIPYQRMYQRMNSLCQQRNKSAGVGKQFVQPITAVLVTAALEYVVEHALSAMCNYVKGDGRQNIKMEDMLLALTDNEVMGELFDKLRLKIQLQQQIEVYKRDNAFKSVAGLLTSGEALPQLSMTNDSVTPRSHLKDVPEPRPLSMTRPAKHQSLENANKLEQLLDSIKVKASKENISNATQTVSALRTKYQAREDMGLKQLMAKTGRIKSGELPAEVSAEIADRKRLLDFLNDDPPSDATQKTVQVKAAAPPLMPSRPASRMVAKPATVNAKNADDDSSDDDTPAKRRKKKRDTEDLMDFLNSGPPPSAVTPPATKTPGISNSRSFGMLGHRASLLFGGGKQKQHTPPPASPKLGAVVTAAPVIRFEQSQAEPKLQSKSASTSRNQLTVEKETTTRILSAGELSMNRGVTLKNQRTEERAVSMSSSVGNADSTFINGPVAVGSFEQSPGTLQVKVKSRGVSPSISLNDVAVTEKNALIDDGNVVVHHNLSPDFTASLGRNNGRMVAVSSSTRRLSHDDFDSPDDPAGHRNTLPTNVDQAKVDALMQENELLKTELNQFKAHQQASNMNDNSRDVSVSARLNDSFREVQQSSKMNDSSREVAGTSQSQQVSMYDGGINETTVATLVAENLELKDKLAQTEFMFEQLSLRAVQQIQDLVDERDMLKSVIKYLDIKIDSVEAKKASKTMEQAVTALRDLPKFDHQQSQWNDAETVGAQSVRDSSSVVGGN